MILSHRLLNSHDKTKDISEFIDDFAAVFEALTDVFENSEELDEDQEVLVHTDIASFPYGTYDTFPLGKPDSFVDL